MRTALLHLFLCSSLAMAQQPGTLDPTFNPTDNGHFLGDGVQAGIVEEVLQLSDGKLLIGGDFGRYNGVETGDVLRLNSDGTVDPSFNAYSGSSGAIKALAAQGDGKVLIGGYFNTVQGVGRKSIARLNADGSLDTSFNPGSGLATGTANLAEVRSIALQADGRILIAGSFISFNGTARNNIARLNTDGSLDLSFAPGTGTNSSVEVVKITSEGMILIGGSFSTYNGSTSNNIARIYSNGTLDTSFDAGTGVGIGSGNVACIQERADGRLYIGGSFVTFNGTDCLHTARLMADGSLDNAYNSTIGPGYSFNLYNVRSIAEQTDGSVLIGGLFTTFDGTTQPHLVRVTSTGAFDPTYTIGNGPDQPVFGIVLRPDGKAVVCGSFSAYDETSAFGITVVNTNGSRDTAFNPGMGFNNAAVSALSVLADGRIMAQGGFYGYNGITRRGLARLMPDGDLDTTFDPGAGAAGGAPLCMAVQADNKVLVGGWFTSFAGVPYNRIARLNSDGSLDLSFNIGTGSNGWVHSIAVQTDGKILVGGLLSVFNGSPCNNIVRLNANGSIDASFTPGAGADGRVRNIIPLADGTIMITGDFMNYDGVPRNRIARLLANGSLDPNFDLVSGPNSISQLKVLPDGKIMISGGFSSTTGFPRSGIARLEANGTLDLAFDAQLQYNGAVLGFHVQDDGNIIVVGTPSLAFGGVLQPAIARLLPNGDLDVGFAPMIAPEGSISQAVPVSGDRFLIAGNFSSYDGIGRNRIARIFGGATLPPLLVQAEVLMDGPYDDGSGIMQDQLRTNGLIPTTEPYTALGYAHVGGGGEQTTALVLAVAGNNAIVDWVVIELRSASDPNMVLGTRSALVQRDGDVVDMDGSSPVAFNMAVGNYHVAIRHRNHLGCMSANAFTLSPTPTNVDLTSPTTNTWGTNARKNVNGSMVIWAGDCNADGQLKYTGSNNDRDLILLAVGGTTPTNTITGYRNEDVNMDGVVMYSGTGNDRDRILENIGGVVPTNILFEQLP